MKPLGEVITNLWSFSGWKKRLRAAEVLGQWGDIVGPAVAQVARPRAFSKGTLIIEVRDSVWMTQLKFQERLLLKRLNQVAQEDLFQHIRWVLARGFASPAPQTKDWLNTPVPVSWQEKAQREVSVIEDPELRQAFLRLRLTLWKKKGLPPREHKALHGKHK